MYKLNEAKLNPKFCMDPKSIPKGKHSLSCQEAGKGYLYLTTLVNPLAKEVNGQVQ